MKTLNNRFNTDKPILDVIFDEIEENKLPDYLFDQVCDEFEIGEIELMLLMLESNKYNFERCGDGFLITIL